MLLAAGAAGQGPVVDPGVSPVNLQEVGAPLPRLLATLSTPADPLVAGRDLAQSRATLLLRSASREMVLARLAEVFGAEWQTIHRAGRPIRELRRTRGAASWVAGWKRARERAAAHARLVRAARTRAYLDDTIRKARATPTRAEGSATSLPGGIASVTLTRFLGTFSDRDLDRIALSVAEGTETHPGGEYRETDCPVRYPYSALTETQKRALLAYLHEAGLDAALEEVASSTVGFQVKPYVRLDLRLPSGKRFGDWVMAFSVRADEAALFYEEGVLYLMAQQPTPRDALLGSRLVAGEERDSIGDVVRRRAAATPQLSMDASGGTARLRAAPPRGWVYPEWLRVVHETFGAQVVSDYHTDSRRATPASRLFGPGETISLGSILEWGAASYHRVLKYSGGFLLGRAITWPDRDEEELPEDQWITLLSAKRETGELSLAQLVAISRLTDAQRNGLCAYDDGQIAFRREVEYVRRNPRIIALLDQLTPAQMQALSTREGIRIQSLPSRLQGMLEEEFAAKKQAPATPPADWRQKAILIHRQAGQGPGYRLRGLVAVVPGQQPFWESFLPTVPWRLGFTPSP